MSLKTWPNDCLKIACDPIEEIHKDSIGPLIERMQKVIVEYSALGLAANQIGNPVRVIIVSPDRNIQKVMINPEIIESHGDFLGKEACLSFPGVLVDIRRAAAIKVAYQDENFQHIQEELYGTEAIIVQHEIDHLDGITLYHRASHFDKDRVLRQLKKGVRTIKNMGSPRKMPRDLRYQINKALKRVANSQNSGIGPQLDQNLPNLTNTEDASGPSGPEGQ